MYEPPRLRLRRAAGVWRGACAQLHACFSIGQGGTSLQAAYRKPTMASLALISSGAGPLNFIASARAVMSVTMSFC
jgi:hypothetical protein